MSGKANFGDTLTSGIQDVSALLPLLGTEQCERQVGSALEKGFLYAAATPLSVFGSLGVVKTAFATLLATVTFPFYGGRWLDDAGFGTPGSVSSMVTIAKGGAEYGAEVNLVKLLQDQHIDNLDLVAGVEWSGWKTSTDSQSAWWISMSWNMQLILTSALAALVSISPYLYLISSDWSDPLFWFFPLLRAFGSFLCVVAIQLALQLRIHHIIQGRLLLMKATQCYLNHLRDLERYREQVRRWNSRGNALLEQQENSKAPDDRAPEWNADKKDILEQRLRKLSKFISHNDSEKEVAAENLVVAIGDLADILSRNHDWVLIAYQFIIVIGIPMIVVGYVGCFNLVSQSVAIGGPYIWLGTEAVLSVLRVALWGWNPEWDEGTGMKIKLKLSADTPLITTPYSLGELYNPPRPFNYTRGQNYSFIICSENDFLATAARYTGPLQRFVSSTVSLFYSLVADNKGRSKHLLTTILDLHTRTTQTFYVSVDGVSYIFSSTLKLDPHSNTMRVTLDHEITLDDSRWDDAFSQILDHSKQIASRLCGNGRIDSDALDLHWTLSYSSPKSDLSVSEIAINDGDKIYAEVGNIWINKSSFCERRVTWIQDYMDKWEASWSPNEWMQLAQGIEALHVLENFALEMYLCSKTSAQELAKTDRELAHRLSAEWLHEMESRMSNEKESAMRRLDGWKLHDNVKQHITGLWKDSEVSKKLVSFEQRPERIDGQIARVMRGLHGGDMMELISIIYPYRYTHDSDWWSSPPSEHIRCTLDSQAKWLVHRLKMVLQDVIPSRSDFARFNFAEDPYLPVDDASAHALDAIHLNSSLRAIHLLDHLSTDDINKILKIVAEKSTLTMLVGSDKLVLSADILENNHHILFLPTRTCQQPCTEHPLCVLVHRNRQEWRNSARSAGSDVTYAVGYSAEYIPGIDLCGDEIRLEQDAQCLIMVYTQSNGRLKLSLHHRNRSDLSLDIFLRSGEIGSASEWKEVHSISREDIPERYTNKPHEIVTPELSAGYHEIRIQVKGSPSSYGALYIPGVKVYCLHSAAVTRCESDADSRAEDV